MFGWPFLLGFFDEMRWNKLEACILRSESLFELMRAFIIEDPYFWGLASFGEDFVHFLPGFD